MALRAGLRPTRFLLKISDDPQTSLSEMMERAYKEMNSEDTMDQRIKEVMTWNTPRINKPKENRRNFPQTNSENPRSNQKGMFYELKIKGALTPARPMDTRSQQSRSIGKLCEYHQDQGHTTEECRSLAREIEKHQFAEKLPGPPQAQQNVRGTVFMILGGENSKRKESNPKVFSINKKERKLYISRMKI